MIKKFNIKQYIDHERLVFDALYVHSFDTKIMYYIDMYANKHNLNICIMLKHNINIRYNNIITNISIFKNVYKLYFAWNQHIDNLDMLKLSMLKNVHILDLSHCYNITNIIMLTNIKSLLFRFCKNIKDISTLTQLINLSISTKFYGIHLLKKISYIITDPFSLSLIKSSYNIQLKKLNKYKKLNKLAMAISGNNFLLFY